MRTVLMIIVVLCVSICAFAANQDLSSALVKIAPKTEIAELEALIAQAKASGQTPDPAWTARILELIPLVKGHPGNATYDLQEFQSDGGFAPGAVIRPQQLTPLEQQIKELEFQIDGGASGAEPDPITYANLKEQLRNLYSQRNIRREHDPMDDGANTCPAAVIPSVPYYDFGDTWDKFGSDFDPITPCNTTHANDVIYSFNPQVTTSYTIAIDSADYDTYMYVNRSGACPGTVQVACDDDGGPGLLSLINVTLIAGTTYYIIVDGFSVDSGSYVLRIQDNCNLTCQFGDVIECAEPIVPTHSINDCNGACNNENLIPTWQDIAPGQTICGRGFTYTNHDGVSWRDTDSYRFTLAEPCSLRLTLNSEFATRLFVFNAGCPFGTALFTQVWTNACSTVTFITPCLPAGTYTLWAGPNVFTGIENYRDYRLRMDLIPCSGCRVDAYINAPGSGAWHTCVAGNDCNQRPSQDYNFAVNIPYESDWTFSTCNDDSIWDSFIYLNSTCCGGVIASDDDACGGVGLSVINCVHLQRGTYYLNVEGFSSTSCGPFVLNVSECLGSCCYGDPGNPVCSFINPTDCDSLSGIFTYQEPCSTGACYTRPQCGAGASFGQEPGLPDEAWNAFISDYASTTLQYDNYNVTGPIGSVRFWGVMADAGTAGTPPCTEQSYQFEISFIDTPTTQTYNVSLTGTLLTPIYFGLYHLTEFFATINPPCTLTDGWLRVAGVDSPQCDFYWSTTPFGDGILGRQSPSGGGGSTQANRQYAFCLGGACSKIDSVTILWQPGDARKLDWWMPQAGFVRIYSTTNASAIYPAGYAVIASGTVPAGHFTFTDVLEPDPLRIYVLTVECSNGALQAPDPNSPFRKIE
ncbi:MAG: PPC domain-containing protein [bacterium]|nr:PPC domain-containing protein [bacterium]